MLVASLCTSQARHREVVVDPGGQARLPLIDRLASAEVCRGGCDEEVARVWISRLLGRSDTDPDGPRATLTSELVELAASHTVHNLVVRAGREDPHGLARPPGGDDAAERLAAIASVAILHAELRARGPRRPPVRPACGDTTDDGTPVDLDAITVDSVY